MSGVFIPVGRGRGPMMKYTYTVNRLNLDQPHIKEDIKDINSPQMSLKV